VSIKKAAAKFVEPMLLLRSPSLPDDDGWIREIKLDGYRAIAFKEYGQSAAPIAQRQYRKIRRRLRLVGFSWAR
jgi:ATP-dependent DNA ligase